MPSNDGVLAVARSFRVLVIGGSYGGLSAALNLWDLSRGRLPRFNYAYDGPPPAHRIPIQTTIVDERDGYFHLIGSPKSLACEKLASESWTRFQDIPALKSADFKIIQGTVTKVDCAAQTAHILDTATKLTTTESYDFLIVSSGLRRVFPTVPESLRRDDFLGETRKHTENVRNAHGVVVVGGGAVGVEMAAELKMLEPQQRVTLVHSRDRLLSSEPLPNDFAERVDSILREGGVKVILGQRVVDTTVVDTESNQPTWRLTLGDGRQITTGHVLSAISRCIPTSTYLAPQALDETGYVKVHPSLQFSGNIPNAEHHYAVGDLAAWPGIKRCGGAMHMGHYAAMNIHQQMLAEVRGDKPSLKTLNPFPSVIGLALGKKAVTYTPDEGTRDGEDLLTSLFGDDMGNSNCRNYLKLSEACQA
ncbi:FAD-dependent pyridine nucleotide-disulfide oxidoreductase [Penicillium canariense]|uniref:FAD-dependent pyridine nucleotide-disulfide oxidoreductase n=1 Tax=Penicillium canariense TaxID=189055 RepID=A0A9W9I5T6_9EURO|nr:FAD-dependent pyridine nucleotide-disulfide oxidoreductase [Penicillium canariense]KAJ5167551.1 FAD-dependent pyridine nucleotide-disulfide oxidoreductase [Penicillium canariense]